MDDWVPCQAAVLCLEVLTLLTCNSPKAVLWSCFWKKRFLSSINKQMESLLPSSTFFSRKEPDPSSSLSHWILQYLLFLREKILPLLTAFRLSQQTHGVSITYRSFMLSFWFTQMSILPCKLILSFQFSLFILYLLLLCIWSKSLWATMIGVWVSILKCEATYVQK